MFNNAGHSKSSTEKEGNGTNLCWTRYNVHYLIRNRKYDAGIISFLKMREQKFRLNNSPENWTQVYVPHNSWPCQLSTLFPRMHINILYNICFWKNHNSKNKPSLWASQPLVHQPLVNSPVLRESFVRILLKSNSLCSAWCSAFLTAMWCRSCWSLNPTSCGLFMPLKIS